MSRKIESMEFIHDPDADKTGYSSFGASADEDDDTPYDAFTKTVADADDDEGIEVDINPKKSPKTAAPEEDDADFEIVADDEPEPKAKKAAVDEDDDGDEISAEEMESYSDKVRNRIRKQTRMQRTAERRAERATKEADQALSIIQAQQEQITRMRMLIANGETQYVNAATVASKSALDAAKSKLRSALEAGDAEGIVNAQAELAQATNAVSQTGQYRAVAPEIERDAGVIDARVKDFAKNRQAQEFEPDPAAKRWISRNEWFEKDTRMRSYAIEFAKELEADGYDPIADAKEYYSEINKEMRKRFPEKFDDVEDRPARRAAAAPQRRPVAGGKPASSGGAQNRVRLTESAVRTAQVLGIPVAEYAKEYQKMYGKKG
jgi:hypothetical protein